MRSRWVVAGALIVGGLLAGLTIAVLSYDGSAAAPDLPLNTGTEPTDGESEPTFGDPEPTDGEPPRPRATATQPPSLRPEPDPRAEVFGHVDRLLDEQPLASVAFNTPNSLRLHESAEIELLLSLQESIEELEAQVAQVGEREGARVRITPEMEAELTGLDFEIEPITPQRQLVGQRDVTRWRWQVRPIKTGDLRLHLTLTAFVQVAGETRPRSIRTFDRTLIVNVTWTERVASFLEANWQWLWTAVLVPIALWGLQSYRRRSAAT
jgi:hypothetical protein